MADFTGFSAAALDFYDDLEADNSKSFFTAHKAAYDDEVRAPMLALMSALADEFGDAKLFRPYRDVRYGHDKTPYKTQQGAFVAQGQSTGWYLQVDASGFRVGAGFYYAEPAALARFRRSVHDDVRGRELETILAKLRRTKWSVGGDVMKTRPRGVDPGHPRLELLRHRSLTVGKHYGYGEDVLSADLLPRVRKDWRATTPLVEWVSTNASAQSDDGS